MKKSFLTYHETFKLDKKSFLTYHESFKLTQKSFLTYHESSKLDKKSFSTYHESTHTDRTVDGHRIHRNLNRTMTVTLPYSIINPGTGVHSSTLKKFFTIASQQCVFQTLFSIPSRVYQNTWAQKKKKINNNKFY